MPENTQLFLKKSNQIYFADRFFSTLAEIALSECSLLLLL